MTETYRQTRQDLATSAAVPAAAHKSREAGSAISLGLGAWKLTHKAAPPSDEAADRMPSTDDEHQVRLSRVEHLGYGHRPLGTRPALHFGSRRPNMIASSRQCGRGPTKLAGRCVIQARLNRAWFEPWRHQRPRPGSATRETSGSARATRPRRRAGTRRGEQNRVVALCRRPGRSGAVVPRRLLCALEVSRKVSQHVAMEAELNNRSRRPTHKLTGRNEEDGMGWDGMGWAGGWMDGYRPLLIPRYLDGWGNGTWCRGN